MEEHKHWFLNVPGSVWLTGFIILMIGIVLIFISAVAKRQGERGEERRGRTIALLSRHPYVTEAMRDIGLSFIVALIVTLIYEVHTRTVFDHENMEGILNTIMSSSISPNTWKTVNSHILQKGVIRRDPEIYLWLKPCQQPDTCDPCVAELVMDYSYNLYSLKYDETPFTIQHSLDRYLVREVNGQPLPRFDWAVVGEQTFEHQNAQDEHFKENEKEVMFVCDIKLAPRNDKDPKLVHVHTRRRILMTVPGEYSLMMPDLTEGAFRVHFSETPPGLTGAVKTWWKALDFKPLSHYWLFEGVMLPGQGFAIQYSKEGKATPAPSTVPAPSVTPTPSPTPLPAPSPDASEIGKRGRRAVGRRRRPARVRR
jgi:hypothetical protein